MSKDIHILLTMSDTNLEVRFIIKDPKQMKVHMTTQEMKYLKNIQNNKKKITLLTLNLVINEKSESCNMSNNFAVIKCFIIMQKSSGVH